MKLDNRCSEKIPKVDLFLVLLYERSACACSLRRGSCVNWSIIFFKVLLIKGVVWKFLFWFLLNHSPFVEIFFDELIGFLSLMLVLFRIRVAWVTRHACLWLCNLYLKQNQVEVVSFTFSLFLFKLLGKRHLGWHRFLFTWHLVHYIVTHMTVVLVLLPLAFAVSLFIQEVMQYF